MALNDEDKRTLLQIARQSIEEEFGLTKVDLDRQFPPSLQEKNGAFVTLGCIGYIYGDRPLYKLIYEVAKKSAFEDPRFYPLSKEELDDIDIEISVLTIPKRLNSIDEIEIGKHGLIIQKGPYHGLLLPQVAEKYNWTPIEFLEHTSRKAGLHRNDWKDPNTIIEIFTAEVFSEKELGGIKNDNK